MNIMSAALKKAGVVDETDVRRAEKEKQKDAETLQRGIQAYAQIVNAFPARLGDKMAQWIEANRTLIPVKVLLHWRDTLEARGEDAVWREWSKWRKTWRKVQAEKKE